MIDIIEQWFEVGSEKFSVSLLMDHASWSRRGNRAVRCTYQFSQSSAKFPFPLYLVSGQKKGVRGIKVCSDKN